MINILAGIKSIQGWSLPLLLDTIHQSPRLAPALYFTKQCVHFGYFNQPRQRIVINILSIGKTNWSLLNMLLDPTRTHLVGKHIGCLSRSIAHIQLYSTFTLRLPSFLCIIFTHPSPHSEINARTIDAVIWSFKQCAAAESNHHR